MNISCRFIIHYEESEPEDRVFVVGNAQELGNWDADKAVRMIKNGIPFQWISDTVEFPQNIGRIEFKYIIKNKNAVRLEEGENRLLDFKSFNENTLYCDIGSKFGNTLEKRILSLIPLAPKVTTLCTIGHSKPTENLVADNAGAEAKEAIEADYIETDSIVDDIVAIIAVAKSIVGKSSRIYEKKDLPQIIQNQEVLRFAFENNSKFKFQDEQNMDELKAYQSFTEFLKKLKQGLLLNLKWFLQDISAIQSCYGIFIRNFSDICRIDFQKVLKKLETYGSNSPQYSIFALLLQGKILKDFTGSKTALDINELIYFCRYFKDIKQYKPPSELKDHIIKAALSHTAVAVYNEIDNENESTTFTQTKNHLEDILRSLFDKIYSIPTTFRQGITSFDEKVFISEDFANEDFDDSEAQKNAAFLVIVLREIGNLLRLRYVAKGNYFFASPDQAGSTSIKEKEVGTLFEKKIFGAVINKEKISEKCNEFILNTAKWENGEITHVFESFPGQISIDRGTSKCFRPS